jgi:hypothetical protein
VLIIFAFDVRGQLVLIIFAFRVRGQTDVLIIRNSVFFLIFHYFVVCLMTLLVARTVWEQMAL